MPSESEAAIRHGVSDIQIYRSLDPFTHHLAVKWDERKWLNSLRHLFPPFLDPFLRGGILVFSSIHWFI